MRLHLDAAILVCLAKNQKGWTSPSQSWYCSFQLSRRSFWGRGDRPWSSMGWKLASSSSLPPPRYPLDPSSRKKPCYKNTLALLRHIKELIIKQSWRRKLILETHEVTIFFFSWRWGRKQLFSFSSWGHKLGAVQSITWPSEQGL